jgi:heme exporter protein C
MVENIKKYWWKIIGFSLVLVASLGSFFVPLSPGILESQPTVLSPGVQNVTLTGYNTDFTKMKSFVGYFTTSDRQFAIPFNGYNVVDENTLEVQIVVPDTVRGRIFDLVISSVSDGTIVTPMALVLSDVVVNGSKVKAYYQEWPVKFKSRYQLPFRRILYETIRNLNFHVVMWFAMLFIMLIGVIYSVKFLKSGDLLHDRKANEAVRVGLFFAFLGLITGSIWARFTWGAWWVQDAKLNGAAISTLIYLAYLVLRGSVEDEVKRGRLVAVYSIFAFVMLIVFVQVLPRMTDSLHPGNGGNPAFSQYDLDNKLRALFYPAVLGWILMATWVWQTRVRISTLKEKLNEDSY